jgi:hypothetical protein
MTPRRAAPDRRDQRDEWVILALAAALFCGSVALLAIVAGSLRKGYFDARPRGAPRVPPELIRADQEPFAFYGLTALAAAIGIYAAILAWGMMKEFGGRR